MQAAASHFAQAEVSSRAASAAASGPSPHRDAPPGESTAERLAAIRASRNPLLEAARPLLRALADLPGLQLNSNAYRGVSLNDCVLQSRLAAERVLRGL